MSYIYSFNTPPPTGFSINASTGLITIAASAAPFTGNLSVKVSDGISIVVKNIPVVLAAPIVTPLILEKHSATCSSGGTVVAMNLDIRPVVCDPGIGPTFAVLEISRNVSTCSIGDIRIESLIEDAQGPIPIVIEIDPYSGSIGVGNTETYTATVQQDWSTAGLDQSVSWAIVPSAYSNYGTLSTSGGGQCTITAVNGSWYFGDKSFELKATSIAYPSVSKTIQVDVGTNFANMQVTASPNTVTTGQTITINSSIDVLGESVLPTDPDQPYFNVVIIEGGNYTYRTGSTVLYTAGSYARPIEIRSSYYKPFRGEVAVTSITIQNMGGPVTPPGLTIVPSYTVTHTGDTQYASLDWASLNDADGGTGVATGSYYSGSGDCAIVLDLGSPKLIKKIDLAGGYFGGSWGDTVAQYLNGGFLEYSANGSTWTNYATIAGVTDGSTPKEYIPNITAQYWRIRRAVWCATSAFTLYTEA